MAYQFTPISLIDTAVPTAQVAFLGPPASGTGPNNGFPSASNCALLSTWVQFPVGSSATLINWLAASFIAGAGTSPFIVSIHTSDPPNIAITVADAAGAEIGIATFLSPADMGGRWNNILVSVDAPNHVMQCYVNDVPVATEAGFTWSSTNQIGWSNGTFEVSTGTPFGFTEDFCVADHWIGALDTFFDLSIEANRRKFVTAAVKPVDLGASGSAPTGSSPTVFLTIPLGGVVGDFVTNAGTGSAFVAARAAGGAAQVELCPGGPFPPIVPSTELPQSLPQSLGRWRGQVGINWQGMALVGDAFSNVVGLSDFDVFTEYGETMRMLITTPPVHSDRKRIFISRFEIEVQSGQGMADGAPQMMLDWSKDGGVTWAPLQVFRSMGSVGEYIKRLRWLNLGMSRTWVFRLTCTDPVRRYIIGTYLDEYRGVG